MTIDMDHLMARLKLTMEYDVIRSLLSGNDTGCFTTAQYLDARDAWMEKHVGTSRAKLGLGPADEYEFRMARKQLESVPQLIREVRDNIWAACEVPA